MNKQKNTRGFDPLLSVTELCELLGLALVEDKEIDHLLFFTRNHKPMQTGTIRRPLRQALDETGVTGVHPHMFCKTVATILDRAAGVDLAAEVLGHSPTEITKAH